jgi:hypothetical protein
MKRTILSLFIFLLLFTSCASTKKSIKEEIIGIWMDKDGYSIQFRPDGSGFIPGVSGKIPDSTFYYSIMDDSHVKIDLQGQSHTIGIDIKGDQLTWKDTLGEVVYTRVK